MYRKAYCNRDIQSKRHIPHADHIYIKIYVLIQCFAGKFIFHVRNIDDEPPIRRP